MIAAYSNSIAIVKHLEESLKDFLIDIPSEKVMELVNLLNQYTSGRCYCMDNYFLNSLGIDCGNKIYISSNERHGSIRWKHYLFIFRVQKNTIREEWIKHLQLLDTMMTISEYPFTELIVLLERYCDLIRDLNKDERKMIVILARKYPPFIRTVLALVFKKLNDLATYYKLKQTIAPNIFNRYEVGLKVGIKVEMNAS